MPFALFATALGTCGIAWGGQGVTALYLPEGTPAATRARVVARSGDDEAPPPPGVRAVIDAVTLHLAGTPADLSAARLDMRGVPPFHARVYDALRAVESGSTVGYGELAARAGSPKAFRAVGQAMAKNPFPLLVPCHRVLAAGGKPGGFSAHGGVATKARLLDLEGVTLEGPPRPPPRGRVAASTREPLAPRTASAAVGLMFDPAEAARVLAASDRMLARIIAKVGPLRLEVAPAQSPFAAVAESITYQQLTGKAAATILGRVHALFGGRENFTPDALLALPDARLREAGLSGAKTAAMKDLAAKTLDGTVPTHDDLCTLQESEIVERLTTIRGVGRWTVQMLLIFRLGWPDVLPVNDYGVRKGFARAFRTGALPSPADVAKRGERWRPYRTAASWYLWRASELPETTRARTAT
jgi:methylated-DNA-[protein]-cysteine S-methyltransferase